MTPARGIIAPLPLVIPAEEDHDASMTTDQFRPHGINLRPGSDSVHTLYVVRHGARESVEIFKVDVGGVTPTLTWVGCAVAPDTLGLNAVVPLPDGGLAATSPRTSDVWEWHTGTGWTQVPSSEDIGPNGLEISPDGQWFVAYNSLIYMSRPNTDHGPERRFLVRPR